MKQLFVLGISLCTLLTTQFVSAAELDESVRADKSTYFSLQRMNILPIAVEFNEAGDIRASVDTITEANLAGYNLDLQFTKIYRAKRLTTDGVNKLAKALLNGTISDVAQAARANYQFRD